MYKIRIGCNSKKNYKTTYFLLNKKTWENKHNKKLRKKIEAKKLALKEMTEENKILLANLSSIHDNNIHEFIQYV